MKNYRFSVLIILVALLSSCQATYIGRYFRWLFPDIEQPKKFPLNKINCSSEAFHFVDATKENKLDGVEITLWAEKYTGTLDSYLEETKANSFIVIRNDSILYEKYLNGYTRESLNYSFSVTKSVTSTLLFVALDQGFINSVDDKVIKYIPELDSTKFGEINIRDLMDMTSGIKHNHSDWPWGDEAKDYYKPNIRKFLLKKLKMDHSPGEKFDYNNFNTLLIGMIIERASGQSLSDFFEKNIWKKIGTEYPATWVVDSKKHHLEKTESGFSATAVDFARFAQLMIDGTNHKGEQIISRKWVDKTCVIDTSIISLEQYGYYNLLQGISYNNSWWQFYNKENKEFTALLADGIFWQYLYINPSKNLVIVRMGNEAKNYDPDNFRLFKNIAKLCK